MISIGRVLAVLKKDIFWAKGNMKLLGIMVMPLFFVVLFAKMDSESTFGYVMAFINAFVGIFFTSYLIVEEKRSGTLLALLTSPLKNHELLLGKFLFTLGLCLSFSLFALFMNNRMDLLANPMALFNIMLFAGMTCFLGFAKGLFFKSEQEMSFLSPLIMLFFSMGSAVDQATSKDIHAFFPDYHLTKILSTMDMNWSSLLTHTGFNILYFVAALIFSSVFAAFYFSNSREKRFSMKLLPFLALVLGGFVVSGVMSPKIIKDNDLSLQDEFKKITFDTNFWAGDFTYNPGEYLDKVVLDAKTTKVHELTALKDKDFKIVIGTRKAKQKESTPDKRAVEIHKSRDVMARESVKISDLDFGKWVYYKSEKIHFLNEGFCGEQLFQVHTEVKKEDLAKTKAYNLRLTEFIKNINLKCKELSK